MELTKEEIRRAILELEDNEEWDEDLFAEDNSFPFLSKEARKNYSEYLNRKYYVEVKEEGEWFQLSVKKENETKGLILSTDNLSLKAHKYDCHRMQIENFSYKSGNLPELPKGTPKLSYSGEVTQIENENYILFNDNSFGIVSLHKKIGKDDWEIIFDFEYECIDEDEFLKITSINNENKTDEEVVRYFETILEMFKVLHKYAKAENADNALKSFGRIIPAKIKELKGK